MLALARYYHQLDPRKTGTVLWIIPPFLMIAAPVALIMHQPDLGTAMLIVFAGIAVMFLARLAVAHHRRRRDRRRGRRGLRLQLPCCTTISATASTCSSGMADDPLGAGYHVLQSKIAIGSAGLFGRG